MLLTILITAYITTNVCVTIFGHFCGADKTEKIMSMCIGLPVLIWTMFTK